jgi:predicted glycoside hydrolase/deacetylase ChbG (UPF0249 family)
MSTKDDGSGLGRRDFLASLVAGTATLGMARFPLAPTNAAQGTRPPPLNQRLGYSPSARLLIMHAEDFGLLHAVNTATIEARENGLVNSGNVMAPCPWFPEAAAYVRAHPMQDWGLHLTFISERPTCRWGPVLGASVVPSLVDRDGYFPVSWETDRVVNLQELEAEVRAQVERARHLGVVPTHLDSHAHRLQWLGQPIFDVLLRVATELRVPVRVGRNWFGQYPYLEQALGPAGLAVDRTISIPPEVPPEQWINWYVDTLHALSPGVTELFVHPGADDDELRAFAPGPLAWGSAWRQRDLDAMTSPAVRSALEDANVTFITWRDIGRLLPAPTR